MRGTVRPETSTVSDGQAASHASHASHVQMAILGQPELQRSSMAIGHKAPQAEFC